MTPRRHRPYGRAAALAPQDVPAWRVVVIAVVVVTGLLVAGFATGGYAGEPLWVAALGLTIAVAAAAVLSLTLELEARRRAAAALARLGLAAAAMGRGNGTETDVVASTREVLTADRVVLVARRPDGGLDVDIADPPWRGPLPTALLDVVTAAAQPAVIAIADPAEVGRAWGEVEDPSAVRAVAWIPAISTDGVVGVLGVTVRSARHLTGDHDPLLGAVGRVMGAYVDARARMARLETQASLDGLTGVLNRSALDRTLESMLAGASRRGAPLCVAMLDLDHFKEFNDRHGHLAGDRLLKEVAPALQAAVRRSDAVGRFGGEEFLLAFDGVPVEDALAALHRARTTLPPGVTASAGVAALRPGEAPASLVQRADEALYRAKREGRNRVVVASL